VLVITDLDAGSGTAVIKKAQAAGVPVIDYDRLTLGGGAQYYVSFDNVAVGKLQGQGLQKCMTDKQAPKGAIVAELNGSPDDNNATLFAQGYNSSSTRCTRTAPTPRARTSPCRSGTTPRPAPSSSRC
jgi:ABC-type xylose transport system, periplasmic component